MCRYHCCQREEGVNDLKIQFISHRDAISPNLVRAILHTLSVSDNVSRVRVGSLKTPSILSSFKSPLYKKLPISRNISAANDNMVQNRTSQLTVPKEDTSLCCCCNAEV